MILLAATTLLAAPLLTACGASSRTVTAVFTQTSGLFVGNQVGVLGMPIGKVTAITPDGTSVRVRMEITDSGVRLPAGVHAVIVSRSVATDNYVELTPVYTAGATLPNDAVIGISHTAEPVDYDQVLASLEKFAHGMTSSPKATQSLSQIITMLAQSLSGNGPRINTAVSSLSAAVSAINGQKDSTLGTLNGLAQFTNTLASNDAIVRSFMTNLAQGSSMLASEKGDITTAITSLDSALRTLGSFTKAHRGELDRYITDLTTSLRNADKSRGDLKEQLEVLPLASQNLIRAYTPDGRIRVRQDPAEFLGVQAITTAACPYLGNLCAALNLTPSLQDLLYALGLTK